MPKLGRRHDRNRPGRVQFSELLPCKEAPGSRPQTFTCWHYRHQWQGPPVATDTAGCPRCGQALRIICTPARSERVTHPGSDRQ